MFRDPRGISILLVKTTDLLSGQLRPKSMFPLRKEGESLGANIGKVTVKPLEEKIGGEAADRLVVRHHTGKPLSQHAVAAKNDGTALPPEYLELFLLGGKADDAPCGQ